MAKTKRFIVILFTTVITLLLIFKILKNDKKNIKICKLTILLWTKYYGNDFPSEKEFDNLFQNECPSTCLQNCQVLVTSNRTFLNQSDALIFYGEDLRKNDLPRFRKPDQLWIFHQLESPAYTTPMLLLYPGTFNWTMSYRKSSDIYTPYGQITPKQFPSTSALNSIKHLAKTRKKPVAWLVSHCSTHSKREKFVNQLRKHIPVDIFGKCGNLPCSPDIATCLTTISQNYKFFLSLENSLCLDYITEKYFNSLKYNLLPIVFGGMNSSREYSSLGPPGAFIDANNFKNPKTLANYLWKLTKNPEEYLNYFKWKEYWEIGTNPQNSGWCSLCHKLIHFKNRPKIKIYQNLSNWWNFIEINNKSKSVCH